MIEWDISQPIRIRPGEPADARAVLGMLDGAVVWMNARGNTEQWGTTPFSTTPSLVERVDRYLTENTAFVAEAGGTPVGAMVLDTGPNPQMPIGPAGEPERYVRLLVSDRRHAGRGVGAALLARAAEETRRAGVGLLRVDCWAGGGGELVAYYERQGFTRTEPFRSGTWPGQILARHLTDAPGSPAQPG
ncbi:GNAT family N-acetyltransferase [Streptomyces sp. NPDC059618]|uniref:GNAT family N-acetyltransferase n=1 Tax=Streptomyces sp. NPDC059618 TaxID=3346887 RepID=UPI00369722AC